MRRTGPLKLKESFLTFLIFAIIGFGAVGFAQTASAVSLKPSSLIEGNVITLGHVFSGLDDRKSGKVLGPAPRPGQDMVLNARTLMRVAIALDLPWRPHSNADQVVLSRAATVVSPSAIQDALSDALKAEGIDGPFELAISNSPGEIVLPYGENDTLEVESISFDNDQNRFKAVISAPSKDNPIIREHVSGLVQRLVEIPVLRSATKNGTVIRARDIDMVAVRTRTLNHDTILQPEELIGMTPRRIVLAGNPVKENDVQAPQVVSRGELVVMTFQRGALTLTAQGKALENGAKGDVIRIVNANSSRTLEARVTGDGEVQVESF